eukprot:1143118-Amorphochlora_amoeboformis.AAC.1
MTYFRRNVYANELDFSCLPYFLASGPRSYASSSDALLATPPLVTYFRRNVYAKELNFENPLGMDAN